MRNKVNPLPESIIRESLELDPTSETWLRWKFRPRHIFRTHHGWRMANSRDAGKPAGSKLKTTRGCLYWVVGIDYNRYLAHRIVWFLTHGFDPGLSLIDHVDGNGRNNNPENLRLATNAENLRNQGVSKSNTSGRSGVSWDSSRNKWCAYVSINEKKKHLGRFATIEEAISAREKAEEKFYKEFAWAGEWITGPSA